MSHLTPEQYNRFCDVIENNIVPLTDQTTKIGCRVFGAAILKKSDLSLVLASTNHAAFSPLWHGEMYCIKQFFEKQGHPDPSECIFISTHEPCCMCTAAIAWSGFKEVYYFFDYKSTNEDFNIPHDQKMIDDLFGCKEPNHNNSYYKMYSLPTEIEKFSEKEKAAALKRYDTIGKKYAILSEQSQRNQTGIIV